MFTNRGTSGRDYVALQEAIDRLAGTRISTNIRAGDEEQYEAFGLDGRLLWCEVKLSDWVFNAIEAQQVLTLHRDYFRLKKPLERRVYELARKHCGHQDSWSISLSLLLKKSGSQSPTKRFRQMIKHIAKHNHLPDYLVFYDEETDKVIFENRGSLSPALPEDQSLCVSQLRTDTYERAKTFAPGWDVYHIENEWRGWLTEPPRNPDAAFLGFCKKWYEKRGPAR